MRYCADCSCINLTYQETDDQYSETTLSKRFHIYPIIECCNAHSIIPLNDKKICHTCKQEYSSDESTKIYTRKESVMVETKNSGFHTIFYIPAIQNLVFCLPHTCILGTNHCGEMRRTAFKRRKLFQDVLCRRDYSERLVARFDHQILSEYYGGNISVSI